MNELRCVAETNSAFGWFGGQALSPPVGAPHDSGPWSRIVPHQTAISAVAVRARKRRLKDYCVLRATSRTAVAERRLVCFAHAPVLASDEPGGVPNAQACRRALRSTSASSKRDGIFKVARSSSRSRLSSRTFCARSCIDSFIRSSRDFESWLLNGSPLGKSMAPTRMPQQE